MRFDWVHTVKAVAPIHTAAMAATSTSRRSSRKRPTMRTTARNQKKLAPAESVAPSALILSATGRPVKAVSTSHARPTTTKSGFPGGWGSPRMCAVVTYSDASQKPVVGARVRR